MRLKSKCWWLLGLLFFAAAVWFFHAGERRAASRGGAGVSPVRTSHGSVGSDRSDGAGATAPVAVAARSYRLSNTTETLEELRRNTHAILLRNALIDTSVRAELAIPEALRAHGAPGSYLVQSDRALDKGFYAALKRDGAEVVSYIPNNAALVWADEDAARTLMADRTFQAVLAYQPYFKLDGSLLPGAVNGEALTNTQLRVTVLPGQDYAAEQALAGLGAEVTDREASPFGGTTFIVTAPADQLAAVAQLPQTQEIEPVLTRVKLNDLTRGRLGVASSTVARTNYLGLTGTNIWMGLADTGVDGTHQDFSPSRVTGATTDPDGHGTHVAATMIGGGNQSYTVTNFIPGSVTPTTNLFRGMAPQANLFVQSVDIWTGPYISDYYLASNASFMLTSNTTAKTGLLTNGFVNDLSWGYQSMAYDLSAALYDQATRNAQPNVPGEHSMLFVVAAGNGNQAAGSILSPATAKNVIAVGAIDSPRFITNDPIFESTTYYSNAVTPFSSGGNVGIGTESAGGRFKPDVVAPGSFTISARAANFVDPTQQEVLGYATLPGQSNTPGQASLYEVYFEGPTTNVIVQLVPNQFSPVPFPTNFSYYFDVNDPPVTAQTGTNAAGLPEWANMPAGSNYLEIVITNYQAWPVAYDLRVYGIGTNGTYSNYYAILSTNLNASLKPYYRYESGTSMAAAAVSGMLALMQQYLFTNFNMCPSPALLKALLINGARPLNENSDLNPAPSVNLEGYGLPNLSNSIPASLNTNHANHSMVFFDQSPTNALQTGEWHTYAVSNNADPNFIYSPLRITLVWTDPPGNPAAGLALVNDLDLVVTDSQSNVYVGNDFLSGDIYTEARSTTNMAASDTVNNVENVFIDATYGLLPPYTISVRGTHVNVNAATLQTNIIGQDYALVISSDDQKLTNSLTVTDLGTTQEAAEAVSVINNGAVLLHQRVGANEPNTNRYPGGGLYTYPGSTNGNLVQWKYFYFTNINYLGANTNDFLVTNTVTNGTVITTNVANLANQYTNAIIATFLPETLTIPVSSPDNASYPAAGNADIDLYVSTNPALFQLDTNALAVAHKSLGQGGNETVFLTNIVSNAVLYIAVKSETQQGADFDVFATLATNFNNQSQDSFDNTVITVSAYALPVAIPDDFASGGEAGAQVIVFVPGEIMVRKVQVTVGVDHENPSDLYGVLTHGGQQTVLNHYTGDPGGFTNTYDDLPEGETSLYPIVPSDGPGTLENFVGIEGSGQWILNEKDSVFTQTGMVTMLTLTIWPQPPPFNTSGGTDYTNVFTLTTNGVYYGYVDVPNDATNMEIGVIFTNAGPVGIFLTNQEVVNTGDYGTNVTSPIFPENYLGLSSTLPTNWPASNGPPLSGGRWYYLITNESGLQMTVTNWVVIQESGTPNLTLTEYSPNTNTPLTTDAHTLSQICLTNGIWTNNQQLASLQVGLCIADTNADDLVVYLTSPQGTSTELFENRGGPLATNLGLVNGTNGYVYLTFTDNTNLAPDLVKFFPPPLGKLLSYVNVVDSSFETVSQGDYGQSNGLLPSLLGTNLEGWAVVSNDVAVVTGSGRYPAAAGTNYLALADGEMTTALLTVPGQGYTLTFDYRGPGLVDWWRFDGDLNDSIGVNNGTLSGDPVGYVPGVVGQAIQFPGTTNSLHGAMIDFGSTTGAFGTNDFTIDFWIKTSSTKLEEAFLSTRASCDGASTFWQIQIGSGVAPPHGTPVQTPGYIGFILGPGGGQATDDLVTSRALNDGNWHHVAWVRKTASSGISTSLEYLDGTLDNTREFPTVVNLVNHADLTMSYNVCECCDGTVPFSGAADELDFWNRALTDVEIAAIYQAGTNGIGKATPVSILPNCGILVTSGTNSITNTLIVTNASGPNWLTNMVYFTAMATNTTITLKGNPLGMLFDGFLLEVPANLNYVQPEEPLAPLIGENPYGCWTLDVWDTRLDSTSSNNGVLYSWALQMTVSSTNTSLIVLTNGFPYAGTVGAGSIAYFAFDVAAGVSFATNTLSDNTNLSLLFNQTALPIGNQLGDYTLLTNVITNGTSVLSNNAPPPALAPGARYFLGVQNTNSVTATFTIQVTTNVLTAPAGTVVLILSGGAYTNTIAAAPQYYSFDVPTDASFASFYLTNITPGTNQLGLYVRHALPVPSDTTFDYDASYDGTNGEPIIVISNSVPVPLTPGTWYLAVYNYNTNTANSYAVVASRGSNTPAAGTNAIVFVTGMGVSAGGFTFHWAATPGRQYAVDVSPDLIHWTKETNISAASFIGTFTDPAPVAIQAARFYRILSLPAGVAARAGVSGSQLTLKWTAESGAQYQVSTSSDLIHWTSITSFTANSSAGAYSETVNQKAARFYQVLRTQ